MVVYVRMLLQKLFVVSQNKGYFVFVNMLLSLTHMHATMLRL